jgi:hypothetical protein
VAVELGAVPAARRSRGTDTDYPAARAGLAAAEALPGAVDLRRDWLPVADQGETASCVGWAIADSCVRWHLVEAGRLEPAAALSARYVWMSAKETDAREDYPSAFLEKDGTSLKAGLDVVRRWGVALEAELPWQGGLATQDPEAFNAGLRRRRIMAYYTLHGAEDRFAEWRRWLAASGPVLVLVQDDAALRGCTGELAAFDAGSVRGSHAAALFGYDERGFLLRSSWGTDWGDAGYARMSEAYAAESVIESYGVMV